MKNDEEDDDDIQPALSILNAWFLTDIRPYSFVLVTLTIKIF